MVRPKRGQSSTGCQPAMPRPGRSSGPNQERFGAVSRICVARFQARLPCTLYSPNPASRTQKENDLTETAKTPIDDSKEELSEAELDKVAGGAVFGYAMVEKKHTQPETRTHLGNSDVEKTHPNPDVSVGRV